MAAREIPEIVDFIYYGLVNTYQEEINSFLAAAEELWLKGLAHSWSSENTNYINKGIEQFLKYVEEKRFTNSKNKNSPEFVLIESNQEE